MQHRKPGQHCQKSNADKLGLFLLLAQTDVAYE